MMAETMLCLRTSLLTAIAQSHKSKFIYLEETFMTMGVAIIGGGIAGLSCAYELQKKGVKVKVFEKNAHAGGRMATRTSGGFAFDTGAQIFGRNYTSAYQYCEELKIADEWVVSPIRNDYIFRQGQLHLLGKFKPTKFLTQSNLLHLTAAMLRFRWASRGMNLLDLTKKAEIASCQNAYDYAVHIAGQEIVDYIIDPLFYGNNFYGIKQLSVSALLSAFRFAALDVRQYCHLQGGSVGRLPGELAQLLDIKYSTAITKLESFENKVEIQLADKKEAFDIAVLAMPTTSSQQIYANPTVAQQEMFAATHYSATITLSFLVPAEPIKQISMGFVPSSESHLIASFVGQPVKGKEAIQEGKGLLNVFLRDAAAKQLMDLADDKIFARIKPELLHICPALKSYGQEIDGYDLQRWPQAIPHIPPGYIAKVDRFWHTGQGQNRVYLCGDYLAAPYVEGSIRCGKRVASAILNQYPPLKGYYDTFT
jgi:oxygen-dependent protoporphyrinogen oxidase